jgi:RNA polymerase sigma-70 factor (ECF subfamily)
MLGEKELVTKCTKEDRAAQKALYDSYCRKLFAVCLRYAKNAEEAEDILQEGFIKIFRNIKNFRFESQLGTWMTRIMINTALNHQRQKIYLLPMLDVEKVNLEEDETISLADFHFSELTKMVNSLPDGCRIVFNLFAIEGYGHKEIGEMLGISEGTSKSQYNRAKNLLKGKLEAERIRHGRYRETKI